MSQNPRLPRRFRRSPGSRASMRGVTLIELMISLMLGVMVMAAAGAIFVQNRATYRATESLGRVQESGRMSFELMARDLREAAGNPCGKNLPLANVLNGSTGQWWTNWTSGIVGFDGGVAAGGLPFGTATGNRIAGTDAIELMSGDNSSGVTVVQHVPSSAQFKLNTINHNLDDSDIAIVCDFRQAALFQVTNAQPGTNEVIVHNTGSTAYPGNCTKGLGLPVRCTTNGTPYTYGPNSMVVRIHAVRWYIGRSNDGGNSLFRSTLINTGGVLNPQAQEIVEGVDNMQLQYLQRGAGDYVDAAAVTNWNNVTSVRVVLNLTGRDQAGVGNTQLQRVIAHTVTLRNRMQ